MTDFERKTTNAILGRMKADIPNATPDPQLIRQRWGLIDDQEVNEALKNGYEAYRRQVRDRILNDHKDQVFINRCSQCNCIVRTPAAKLCLWCGHSWFEQN